MDRYPPREGDKEDLLQRPITCSCYWTDFQLPFHMNKSHPWAHSVVVLWWSLLQQRHRNNFCYSSQFSVLETWQFHDTLLHLVLFHCISDALWTTLSQMTKPTAFCSSYHMFKNSLSFRTEVTVYHVDGYFCFLEAAGRKGHAKNPVHLYLV